MILAPHTCLSTPAGWVRGRGQHQHPTVLIPQRGCAEEVAKHLPASAWLGGDSRTEVSSGHSSAAT